MSSRWKKVWTDFWGNKSRTFLTIITIAVGVLAVGFNTNLGLYMAESMDGDYLSASPSEATVFAGPLDDDMVKIAREVPGVDAVEGRSSVSANVVRTDDKKVSIQFTAVEDPSHTTLNQLKPALGETSLPPLADKEIIVDASAKSLGYKPGDTITV
jgi:putative ABC transport system permease protein